MCGPSHEESTPLHNNNTNNSTHNDYNEMSSNGYQNGTSQTTNHHKDDDPLKPLDLLVWNWPAFAEECHWLVWDLALPQTLLQLGLIFSSAITAMYVGRTMGPLYLDGFTLGNLTGNLFVTSLLQGLFSASDTLSPQAFGAGNPRELGLLAIRGTVASLVVIVPILACIWTSLETIFVHLHQDPQVAKLAAQWFQVFCLGLPSYSISMMIWRFLAAQNLMHPQVIVGITANFVVLPLCLVKCTKWLGFLGSAAAISSFSILHTAMLWAYLWWFQPHHPDTWPGLQAATVWREALEWRKLQQYLQLGLGGMLCYVEWIYWEILVLMAGTFGVIPLSVQTIANMVIEVCAMLPTGVGIAISIRIGSTISTSVRKAQLLSVWSLLIGTVVFALLSLLLYALRHFVVSLFTKDPRVVAGCMEIWVKVCLLHFNVGMYGLVMGIATGLGMQWTLGIVSILILFLMGLPAAYYYAIHLEGGLDQIWYWIQPPYLLISACLLLSFLRTDWRAIAKAIIERQKESVALNGNDTPTSEDVNGGGGEYGATHELTRPLVQAAEREEA